MAYRNLQPKRNLMMIKIIHFRSLIYLLILYIAQFYSPVVTRLPLLFYAQSHSSSPHLFQHLPASNSHSFHLLQNQTTPLTNIFNRYHFRKRFTSSNIIKNQTNMLRFYIGKTIAETKTKDSSAAAELRKLWSENEKQKQT